MSSGSVVPTGIILTPKGYLATSGTFLIAHMQRRVEAAVKYPVLGQSLTQFHLFPSDDMLGPRKLVKFNQAFEGLCLLPDLPLTPTSFLSSFLFTLLLFQQNQTFTARTVWRHQSFKMDSPGNINVSFAQVHKEKNNYHMSCAGFFGISYICKQVVCES